MVTNVGWREQSLVHVSLFSARLQGQMKTTLLALSKFIRGQSKFIVCKYCKFQWSVLLIGSQRSRWVYDK